MAISPSVPTITIIISEIAITSEITIISEVQAIIVLPVVSHPLPVTDPEVVPVTDPEVVRPLDTALGVQPHLVEARPLATAPGVQPITRQEIPEITDLLNPHWEIF